MDDLTLRILKLFYWPNEELRERPSYWAISKVLNTPPATVKRHMDSLSESNIITGFLVTPHNSLIGLKRSLVVAKAPQEVQRGIEKNLDIMDFIHCMFTGTEDNIVLDIIHRGDLKRKLEYIHRLCGKFSEEQVFDHVDEPKDFRSTDVSIAKQLMANPFANIGELCKSTGLSRSTVSKGLARVFEEHILEYAPAINSYNIREGIMVFAVFKISDDLKQKALVMLTRLSSKNLIYTNFRFSNVVTAYFEFATFGAFRELKERLREIENLEADCFMCPFAMITNGRGIIERFRYISDELLDRRKNN